MRIDRLTNQLQAALAEAQSLALGRDHNFILPAHLLLVLLDQKGGTVRPLLLKCAVDVKVLRNSLEELLARQPQVEGTGGEIHVSNELSKLLNVADKLAQTHLSLIHISEPTRPY